MRPYGLTFCRRYARGLAPNSARKTWLKFELKKANQLRPEEHKRFAPVGADGVRPPWAHAMRPYDLTGVRPPRAHAMRPYGLTVCRRPHEKPADLKRTGLRGGAVDFHRLSLVY